MSSAYMMMSTDLFLLFPGLSEKPSEVLGNVTTVMIISFAMFVLCFTMFGEFYELFTLLIASTFIGIVLLAADTYKLKRLE